MFLAFLHGIGQGDLQENWREALDESLLECGCPELDDVEVFSPQYSGSLLTGKLSLVQEPIDRLTSDQLIPGLDLPAVRN
ncbi:hypothetical protein ACI3ET_00045 [Ornithinimicrobium sp. LYQ121]|uniref:hypothetical protein n=1 Tax=Ornithinimicrobium sp. LYQ121 TaxID=3378801 RepID=UPI003854B665